MSQQHSVLAQHTSIAPEDLVNLVPMAQLEPDRLLELSKHVRKTSLAAGNTLFERGDENTVVYYLLDGEIELRVNTASTVLSSEASQAQQPVDPHNPRDFTAVTRTEVTILEIDRELLDLFVSRNQQNVYFVSKAKSKKTNINRGLDAVLQSRIFQMIPPVNIQILKKRFEEIPVAKNQIIFRQDSKGDAYYLIKSGGCAVLRYENPQDGWHVLADLGPGMGFGEEALISNKTRNASVIMSSDGVLLRLSREDFDQLIKTPVVKTIQYENALELANAGTQVLEIREAGTESTDWQFPNTITVSMSKLRGNADKLGLKGPVLVYSNNEQRSACAAYILISLGFEALVISGDKT